MDKKKTLFAFKYCLKRIWRNIDLHRNETNYLYSL